MNNNLLLRQTHAIHSSMILITGATGGLGKALAVECASRGWDLYLTDLNEASLETLATCLRATYAVKVYYSPCDLTDAASRSTLFERFHKQGLHFWALFNVAGTDYEGYFLELSRQQIRTIIRLNVEATLEMTHNLIGYRDPLVPFRIINVASLAAFYPMPVKATYAASKRFLLDWSLALNEELRDQDVSVTVLCPAGMPTTQDTIKAIDAQGWAGFLTTQSVGDVAAGTVDAALKGRAVVIPGFVNQVLQAFSALVPTSLLVHWIGSRWKKAHYERKVEGGREKLMRGMGVQG
jgi:short-subunit dehydrogenase